MKAIILRKDALGVTATAVSLLAPTLLAITTIRLSVNVPFYDEWEWADLSYHARTGTLTFSQLYAPHNEHRNTIPNLVFLLIDRLASWNVLDEQLFSLAVLVAGLVILWRLMRRTISGTRGAIAFAAMSVALCSLGQWENFGLGYNIGWNICTTAVIAVVALLTAPRRSWKHVVLAALIAALASFSSGQGLLLWPIGLFAIILVPREPYRTSVAWFAVAVAVVAAYYSDYHVISPTPLAGLGQAASVVQYSLTYLGYAIRSGSGLVQAEFFGAAVLLALALAFCADLQADRGRFARNAPWYALALYALLGAAFTAVTRLNLGLETATESHYFAIAVFLQVGLVGMVSATWPHLRPSARVCWRAAFVVWCILAVGVGVHGSRAFREYAADRRMEVRSLKHGGPDLVRLAYPDPARLAHLLNELRAVHDVPWASQRGR